jgi:hypothetical protein
MCCALRTEHLTSKTSRQPHGSTISRSGASAISPLTLIHGRPVTGVTSGWLARYRSLLWWVVSQAGLVAPAMNVDTM